MTYRPSKVTHTLNFALHLTHPKCTHTHTHNTHTHTTYTAVTHTRSSEQTTHSSEHTHTPWTHTQRWQPFGAVRVRGVRCLCTRGTASWYWGWRETTSYSLPACLQSPPDRRLKLTTFRLRVPRKKKHIELISVIRTEFLFWGGTIPLIICRICSQDIWKTFAPFFDISGKIQFGVVHNKLWAYCYFLICPAINVMVP